ncbi:MAG: hydrogenase small subunit, partial [Slackia sp.]
MDNKATVPEFQGMLESRGVSRRSFMKLCGTLAVMVGLGEAAAPRVAQALEESVIGASQGDLYPVIWIEGASCTGCTGGFCSDRRSDPTSIMLEMISLNYSETLSAAAGWSIGGQRADHRSGNYILIYEGAVLNGWDGNALRIAGKTGNEHLIEAAEKANAVVALGSCAVNGGWMAAHPNPSNAQGVQQFLKAQGIETPVINVPGCPPNPEWLCAILVEVLLLNKLPELNAENKPAQIFGQTVHDNCQR